MLPKKDAVPKEHRMLVGVRVRTLLPAEKKKGAFACINVVDGANVFAHDPDDKMDGRDYLRLDKTKDRAYAFDRAFGPDDSSEVVYDATVKRTVRAVLDGYNGACFAYGATGSGKTYTMMGSDAAPGVVLLTVDDIFSRIHDLSEEHDATVSISYVEIYNEVVQDLLETSNSNLEVREAPGRGTFVAGAALVPVGSRAEVEALIHKGNLYRTTEATNVNEVSSRSHAVLQLRVSSTPRYEQRAVRSRPPSPPPLLLG